MTTNVWNDERIAWAKRLARADMLVSEAAREMGISDSALHQAEFRHGPFGFPHGKKARQLGMKKLRANPAYVQAHAEASRKSLTERNKNPEFRTRCMAAAAEGRKKKDYCWLRKENIDPNSARARYHDRSKRQKQKASERARSELIARGITPLEIMVPA